MTAQARQTTTIPRSGTAAVTGTVEHGRATITIHRPGKHNAMTTEMWEETTRLVNRMSTAPEVRLIVLRGHGGVFSAGADLSEVLAATANLDAARRYCETIVRTLLTLANSPVPTVAALDGIASGGGVELAIAADHRIAVTSATLQLPFARLGVVPDDFTLERLCSLAGESFVQWMILNGEPFAADECRRRGLIDEIVPPGELNSALDAFADRLARTYPDAVVSTRQRLKSHRVSDVKTAASAMVESFLSGDVESAARSFAARKSPDR